jgi:hypothetical protein
MVSFGVIIIIVQLFSVHNTYIRIINNSALPKWHNEWGHNEQLTPSSDNITKNCRSQHHTTIKRHLWLRDSDRSSTLFKSPSFRLQQTTWLIAAAPFSSLQASDRNNHLIATTFKWSIASWGIWQWSKDRELAAVSGSQEWQRTAVAKGTSTILGACRQVGKNLRSERNVGACERNVEACSWAC